MAIARIETAWRPSMDDRDALAAAVHSALVESLRVPEDDPTLTITECPEGTILRPAKMGDRFTMIRVEMFAGRSLDAKRKLYSSIVDRLGDVGVPPSDVLIVLNEIPMTDWGIEGGVPASDLDVGFKVDV